MSKNASQPDPSGPSTLTTDERRTIAPDLLLDSGLILDKYKLPIVAGVALLVLGLVGSEFYQNSQAKTAAAASAQFDTAKTEADYQKVIDAYPGSQAAANAYLLLGRTRADARNYAGAAQAWQAFVDKFPQHAMVPNALLGQASVLEAQGKPDEARALYQRVATSYSNSYTAPLARLGEADLLLSQRKTEDARHVLEDVIATFPKSYSKRIAEEDLTMLNVLPPLAGAPGAGKSLPATTALTAAPAPSAAATPAEALPIVPAPGSSPAPSASPAAP